MKFLVVFALIAVASAQLQTPNVNYQLPISQQYDSIDPSMQQVNPQWQQLVAQQKWNQIQPTVEQQYLNTINPILSNVGQFGQQYTPEQQQQLLGQQTIPSMQRMKFGLTGVEQQQQQFPIEQFGQTDVNVPLVQQLSAMGIDINTLTPSQLARVQNLINAQKFQQSMKFGFGATEQIPIQQQFAADPSMWKQQMYGSVGLSGVSAIQSSVPLQHKIEFRRMLSLPQTSQQMMSQQEPTLMLDSMIESESLPSIPSFDPVSLQESMLLTDPMSLRMKSIVDSTRVTGFRGVSPVRRSRVIRPGLSMLTRPLSYILPSDELVEQFPLRSQFGRGGRRGGYRRGGYRRGGFRRGGFRRGGYYRPYPPVVVAPIDPYDEEPYVVIDPYASGRYGRWDDPYFYGTTGQVQSPLMKQQMLQTGQQPTIEQIQNVVLPTQQ